MMFARSSARILARCAVILAAGVFLGGCGTFAGGEGRSATASPGWRALATEADRERLRGWRTAWVAALEDARGRGFAGAVAAEGVLLDPDAAQIGPMPTPGAYACRLVRLGGTPALEVRPPARCRIALQGELLRFSVRETPQRPDGHLYPDGKNRLLFLGTMMIGDETRAPAYGADGMRDMIGTLQRIDGGRWRLVLPRPHWGGTMDVMEIVPAQ